MSKVYWPLYEVFVRSKQGLSHRHVGGLHAADQMALAECPRCPVRRSGKAAQYRVVKASEIVASQPEDRGRSSTRRKAKSTVIRLSYRAGRHGT